MSDLPWPLCYYAPEVDEPKVRKIKLGSTVFSPAYTLISVRNDEIVEIELYKDRDYTQLMSEDNQLESFPPSSQMEIQAAFDTWLHERAEDANRASLEQQRLRYEANVIDQVMGSLFGVRK